MLKLPKFKNEAEEAQWWFDHRDEVSAEFSRAVANGSIGEGSAARLARIRQAREEASQAPELSVRAK